MQRAASIQLGPYQFYERLGEGGSGQVYRAAGPGGMVAVKILGPGGDLDEAVRARFRREITALAQLSHPNLVALIDHGIDAELGPYLVLPLLAGTNLRALAARPMCPEAALLLVQPIIHATIALHGAGYIHRDLKPENAIAAPDGTITVIDLGLAWREGMTRHTESGAAVGSVGYMAPEQIDGRVVDEKADVWAIGVMLYEFIAGKRPFARARPAEEAAAALVGSYAPLTAADRRASDELGALVASCLAQDPLRRPSARELALAVDNMIEWADPDHLAAERAAVVADPAAYQARIAAFRIRRLERSARDAIDAGKPFAALALCDRGLAYVPQHPPLLELIAQAERTAGARVPDVAYAETLPSGSAANRGSASGGSSGSAANRGSASGGPSGSAANRGSASGGLAPGPAVPAAPSAVAPRRRREMLVIAGVVAATAAGVTAYVMTRTHEAPSPRAAEPEATLTATTPAGSATDSDRELAKGILGVMGKAFDMAEHQPPAAATANGPPPTTATGWLALASSQSPGDAVASLRHALALNPGWTEAQGRLCTALSAAADPGAVEACNVVIAKRPEDPQLIGARGAAYLEAGRIDEALADLDKAVGADADPKWRRLRARARTKHGDAAGAKLDRQRACELGDAPACREL